MNNSPLITSIVPNASRETSSDAPSETEGSSDKRAQFEAALGDASRTPVRTTPVAGPVDSVKPAVSRGEDKSDARAARFTTTRSTARDASDDDAIDKEAAPVVSLHRLLTTSAPETRSTNTTSSDRAIDPDASSGRSMDVPQGAGIAVDTSTHTALGSGVARSSLRSATKDASSTRGAAKPTGGAQLSDALMARLTKVEPGETLALGSYQYRDALASSSQQPTAPRVESTGGSSKGATTAAPSAVTGAIADLAHRLGADISWRAIPVAGADSPTTDSNAIPGSSVDAKNPNASSASKDTMSAVSDAPAEAPSTSTNAQKQGVANASFDPGGDTGSQPDEGKSASDQKTSATSTAPAQSQEMGLPFDIVRSDVAIASAHSVIGAPTDASSPPGKTRDAKSREASQIQVDGATGSVRVSTEPLRAAPVGSTGVAAHAEAAKNLASSRTAERQADAEIAVSRMTLRDGLRAETVVADLGRVSIEAKTHAENIDLHVVADRADTAALLETHRTELRADLDRSHVPISGISIEAGSGEQGSRGHGSQSGASSANGSQNGWSSSGSGSNQGSQHHQSSRDLARDTSSGPQLDNLTSSSAPHRGRRVRIVL